jgi:hypothetical protein
MREFDITKHYNRFKGHGNGVILKGRVRSGKTTLVGIITNILIQDDFYIITNVRFENWVFEKYTGRIFYITNDIEYLEAYCSLPEGARSVLFFDDAQANKGMTSKGVMTPEGNNLATFLIFIGKLETNYMYMAHQKYLPAPLIEGFNPIMLYTLEIGTFYVSDKILFDESLISRFGYKVKVPNPKEYGLPIISRAVPRFTFKLEWEDLVEYISRYEVGDDLKTAIHQYLQKYHLVENQSIGEQQFNSLKDLTYEKLLLALCLKKGHKLSAGDTIGKLFNANIRQMVRDQLDELGYKDE